MNKMIKMAAIVVGAAAMFAGCGNGGNSPEGVAEAQIKQTIKGFGAEGTMTYKIAKKDIKDNKGVVYVDIFVNGNKQATKTIDVVNENGQWKVAEEVDPWANKTAREISLERAREKNAFNEPGWEYKVVDEKDNGEKAEIKIQTLKNGKEQDTMIYQYTKDSKGIWRSACW